MEKPSPRAATRSASWRPAAAVASPAPPAPAEAISPAGMTARPWSMALDALAGRFVREPPKSGRVAAEVEVASRVEARPTNPATAPWSYVLQRLAAKDAHPASAADGAGGTAPARWKTVAKRSPGETVGELLGSVDWT